MRILFQYFYGAGGALANLMKLLTVYSERFPDYQFFILCHPKSKLRELDQLPNAEVICYGGGRFKELERLRLGLWDLNKIANQKNVDVIWNLNLGSYKKTDIPQVTSLNNAFQVYPKDVLKYHPGNRLKVNIMRFFFKKTVKQSKVVILQTNLMAEYTSKMANIKTHVVPKAVEKTKHTIENQDIGAQNIKVLKDQGTVLCIYIATRQIHKNHGVLFKAFELLKDENISLLVSLEKNDLLEMGVDHDLIRDSKIIPLGWVDLKDLFYYYNLSNISLMPSKLESLSSSHIESMKWKKPLISSDLPFAKDLCGEASLYVNPDKPEDWAKAIRELIASKEVQNNLIKLGTTRMDNFPSTWEEVINDINTILYENKKGL